MTATAPIHEPSNDARVARWLRENPVPPAPSEEVDAWRAGARDLGLEAIDVLIDLLQEAEPDLQYGALLALRALGAEAWAYGYEPDLYYEVTVPGREPQKITPRLQAPPLPR